MAALLSLIIVPASGLQIQQELTVREKDSVVVINRDGPPKIMLRLVVRSDAPIEEARLKYRMTDTSEYKTVPLKPYALGHSAEIPYAAKVEYYAVVVLKDGAERSSIEGGAHTLTLNADQLRKVKSGSNKRWKMIGGFAGVAAILLSVIGGGGAASGGPPPTSIPTPGTPKVENP